MKKILLTLLVVAAALYSAALALPLAPEEQRPGTRLSGTLVEEANPDWSFLQPRQKIWLQTSPWYLIPHSVTTVSFVHDDTLYVPCGRCAGKRWPKVVAADDQVVVKVGDNLYKRRAVRVDEEETKRQVLGLGRHDDMPDVALYRMDAP